MSPNSSRATGATVLLPPHGAYSQKRVSPADMLLSVPDGIEARTVAALMLKGLTAQYLLRRTYRVAPGDVILVHAAAGGMGQILCQWGKHLGATVIGTVGSDDKAEQARVAGCDHTVSPRPVRLRCHGQEGDRRQGCAVVYESIGKDIFGRLMDCLRPLGMMASYGLPRARPTRSTWSNSAPAARCS